MLRVILSSLIVVLGVLRLTRCSRCSYIHFFSLNHDCVTIFLTMFCADSSSSFFFLFVFLHFLLFPFSFLYVSTRMFVVNSVFRRCTRCQWLFSVLRCRPMFWLLLRYETVIRALRDLGEIVCYRKSTQIRFTIVEYPLYFPPFLY